MRRRGYAPEDAQDLTQPFYARLLAKTSLAGADQPKGRFRSFLLRALRRFLADEKDRALAQKRGGGQQLISWEQEVAEERLVLPRFFPAEPLVSVTPGRAVEVCPPASPFAGPALRHQPATSN